MLTYDELLERGHEPPGDCPVCDGGEGQPCGEDCERIARRAHALTRIEALYRHAWDALDLAHRYRDEQPGDAHDQRIVDCIRWVKTLRRSIANVRREARAA